MKLISPTLLLAGLVTIYAPTTIAEISPKPPAPAHADKGCWIFKQDKLISQYACESQEQTNVDNVSESNQPEIYFDVAFYAKGKQTDPIIFTTLLKDATTAPQANEEIADGIKLQYFINKKPAKAVYRYLDNYRIIPPSDVNTLLNDHKGLLCIQAIDKSLELCILDND